MRTDITASQEEIKADQKKIQVYQEKTEVAIKCDQEEMKATVKSSPKKKDAGHYKLHSVRTRRDH
jgi:hypothetical protein